jgi:phosphotransferase system HPr-like phosphotransfer protein
MAAAGLHVRLASCLLYQNKHWSAPVRLYNEGGLHDQSSSARVTAAARFLILSQCADRPAQ